VLLVLLPLGACTQSTTDAGPDPSPHVMATRPTDTLTSASVLLGDSGGEVTMVRGRTPAETLALMVPRSKPGPVEQVCGKDGQALLSSGASGSTYTTCLTAQTVGEWTLVYGMNDLTVASGGKALLQRLSTGGREVVYVADHFDADAPFSVARDGRVVRTFDFCSEGSADEGAALPEEAGLDVKDCDTERFLIAERLTGVSVTEDLLLHGRDRIAVTISY
jgi:hypothetical protein